MSEESNEIYAVAAAVVQAASPAETLHPMTTDATTRTNVMDDKVHHFPLKDAYLCGDCDNVSNSPNVCPSCASEHGMVALSGIVNGTAKAF